MHTTSEDRNPFKTRRAGAGLREIYDARTGLSTGLTFDATPEGVNWAEATRADLWINEAAREAQLPKAPAALVAEPAPAEQAEVAAVVAQDAAFVAEARALGEQLIAELNQIDRQWSAAIAERRAPELIATLRTAYDDTSACVRALGFDIGPVGDGTFCLWDAATQRPLHTPAARPAAAVNATAVAAVAEPLVLAPLAGDAEQIDGILRDWQAEARKEAEDAAARQDAGAVGFATARLKALRRAREAVGRAARKGETLAVETLHGELIVRGNGGRYTVWREGLRLHCECPHGDQERRAERGELDSKGQPVKPPMGFCWHGFILEAHEKAVSINADVEPEAAQLARALLAA